MTNTLREIKFRGKRLDNNEWIYGSFVIREQNIHGDLGYFISTPNGEWIEINSKTVGQYIGLKDKNSSEIWGGDLLKYSIEGVMQVKPFLVENMWDLRIQLEHSDSYYRIDSYSLEIIGNIHEHPNLLTKTDES